MRLENATETMNDVDKRAAESHFLEKKQAKPTIQLNSDRGRILMQLYLHTAPDMKGVLSWVDGYIKLFDNESGGMFITTSSQSQSAIASLSRSDPSSIKSQQEQPKQATSSRATHAASSLGVLTIKVKGLMVSPIGRISMIGNAPSGRSVLVVRGTKGQSTAGIDYESELENDSTPTSQVDNILTQVKLDDKQQHEKKKTRTASSENIRRRQLQRQYIEGNFFLVVLRRIIYPSYLHFAAWIKESMSSFSYIVGPSNFSSPPYLNIILQRFWMKNSHNEDAIILHDENIRHSMKHRQLKKIAFGINEINSIVSPLWLEKGANKSQKSTLSECEYEINLDVDPLIFESSSNREATENVKEAQKQLMAQQQQQLAVSISGSIVSPNCDFAAHISTHALRVNWASITTKAINYSFTMMLLCLAQIVLLLRQLLHSQSNFLASRVSMLTIGWQCVLDAIWCMVHILFCLIMQPLFTAFASVAFFKLLMFCVIEMKYLQIIEQARLASAGHHVTAERIRRQAAIIQCWFYIGLISVITLYWKLRHYWGVVIVFLHSWWVPQVRVFRASD